MASSLLVLAWGCIETDGERPSAPPPIDIEDPGSGPFDCAAENGYEVVVLEDFESGAATTLFTNNDVCDDCQRVVERRQAVSDALNGGDLDDDEEEELLAEFEALEQDLVACIARCRQSQSPTDFDKPLPAAEIPGGRCGSRFALRIQGGPFTDWGGTVGMPFRMPVDDPDAGEDDPLFQGRDVTCYDGIAFWARAVPYRQDTLRVNAVDTYTDSTEALRRDEAGLPYECSADVDLDNYGDGCDPFGSFTILRPSWQWIRLPFREMRQAGSGAASARLVETDVRELSFMYAQGSWDFWLDDIAFYRRDDAGPCEPEDGETDD